MKLKWFSATTGGNVRWEFGILCTADAEVDGNAFNNGQSTPFVVDNTKATALQLNDVSKTFPAATMSLLGCAKGEYLHIQICRNGTADTHTGTARLLGIDLSIER